MLKRPYEHGTGKKHPTANRYSPPTSAGPPPRPPRPPCPPTYAPIAAPRLLSALSAVRVDKRLARRGTRPTRRPSRVGRRRRGRGDTPEAGLYHSSHSLPRHVKIVQSFK